MTKAERQQRHQERLERKTIRESEMFERARPYDELLALTSNLATDLLEKPHLLAADERLDGLEVVLRLWNYPSFTPFRSWMVYAGRWNNKGYFLREVIWNRPADVERIYALTPEELTQAVPSPAIESRIGELEASEFERRRAELSQISIPLFTTNRLMGIDGETFGIAAGDYWQNSQVSWWHDGPQDWQQLTDWFRRMVEYFEVQYQ